MSDFAEEIYKLQELSGADFIAQLKLVITHAEFHPLTENPQIFTVGSERSGDYSNLLNAARKAVTHGFRVCRYHTTSTTFYKEFRKRYEK